MAYRKIKEEYIEWCALDQRTRERNGLPTSQKQFADWKGISAVTLTRWNKEEEVQRLVAQRREQIAQGVRQIAAVPAAPPEDRAGDGRAFRHDGGGDLRDESDQVRPAGMTEQEWQYLQVKRKVLDRALDGNKDAQDLWLKHWGKPFIDAEQSDDESLSGMGDEELARQTVELLGVELVSRVLAEVASE